MAHQHSSLSTVPVLMAVPKEVGVQLSIVLVHTRARHGYRFIGKTCAKCNSSFEM